MQIHPDTYFKFWIYFLRVTSKEKLCFIYNNLRENNYSF